MNIKQIVIALIDRLAAYAAREAENDDPEETKRQEEAASKRLAERVKSMRLSKTTSSGSREVGNQWDSSSSADESSHYGANDIFKQSEKGKEKEEKEKEKEKKDSAPKKFRGIPEDVKLFEVFWQQIVALIKVT